MLSPTGRLARDRSPSPALVTSRWLASSLALAACSSSPAAHDAGHDAGLDVRADSPSLDAHPKDATHDVTDGGPRRGATDAAKPCTEGDAAFDAGPPGTYAANAGAACTRDIDCVAGTFCVVVEGKCAPANMLQGPGKGGLAADGGACATGPSFASCDSTSLAWSDAIDISSSTPSVAECDTALATDGHGRVVVAWTNNLVGGDLQTNGLAVSANDGRSFTPGVAPTHAASDAENDAALAIDGTGLIYYVWEGYANAETGAQHVYASTSKDALTWASALQIDTLGDDGDAGTTPLDFPNVAINPVNEKPYFTYQVTANSGPIPLKLVAGMGGDAGVPASIELDDGTRPNNYRDLANGVFDEHGSFYAAWVELGTGAWASGAGEESGATGDGVYLKRIDVGSAGNLVPAAKDVLVSAATEAVAFGLPRVLVSADGSSLYVVYTVGTANALDVVVAKSVDGGKTFLPSVKVNDDATCATHFKAAATLDAKGRLWVAWYDNREGAGHLAYAVSGDGAATFGPNQLVTPRPFPFETFEYSVGWLGDYFGLVASGTELYAAWPDPHVNDHSHVQFAKASLTP